MQRLFRKLRASFLFSWQDALTYRAEGLVWFINDAVIPLVMIALWLAAYRTVDRVGEYTVQDMVHYYVMFMALSTILTPYPEGYSSYLIRNGTISLYLVRPFPFQLWLLASEVAGRGVRLFFLIPLTLLIFLMLGWGLLDAFALTWVTAPILLASMVLSFLLSYCLKLSIGLLAFWIGNIAGIAQVYIVVKILLAGSIIPLDLMPAAVERVTFFLPFRYLYFFPVQLLQGRLDLLSALGGLAMQGMWFVLAYVLMQLVFAAGVRRYGAYGG